MNIGGLEVYIYKIIIENFRAIKKLEWKPNKNVNVLIGPNGCGKSTLATALDYLLNPYIQWYNRTLSEIEYYDRNTSNSILIEVWFKDLEEFIEDDGELYFQHIDENDNFSENGQELVLITRFKAGPDKKPIHSIFSNGKEHPLRQVHKGLINFKYIESERDPLKELSFVRNSVLSRFMHHDNLNVLIQSVIEEFNNATTASLMQDPDFKAALDNLGNNFANFNLISDEEVAISIEATELNERKTLQAFSLVFKNKNTENYIPIKYQSRGIKNLMLLIALGEMLKETGILFLEEPEQNLEPFMQRKIIQNITDTIKGQIFLTTHSIEVAKLHEFENIFLMRDGKISSIPSPQSVDSVFEKRIERFAKRDLISGLFSKGVLLVEGDSEFFGLPLLSKEYSKGLEYNGVDIIWGEGKDGVYKYAEFYSKCNIPCICLVDNDDDIDRLLNKFVENNVQCLIITLPKDYETSIISMQVFQDCWQELFEEIYKFKEYKDNYLKPFLSGSSKSDALKNKYNNEDRIKKSKSLEQLISVLDVNEIKEFQREFLHINLAGIPNAKYVVSYLIGEAKDRKIKDFLPVAFKNMFNLIGVYVDSNHVCEESKRCIVNKAMNSSFICDNICEKCASIRKGYTNVLKVQGE
ncbi:MAG: putative ATP-dependent endonuclease of the OLD family, contains P-loop ATPase and TOPRIM domains [Clostridium sp.]